MFWACYIILHTCSTRSGPPVEVVVDADEGARCFASVKSVTLRITSRKRSRICFRAPIGPSDDRTNPEIDREEEQKGKLLSSFRCNTES